jgi:hypothetical protein
VLGSATPWLLERPDASEVALKRSRLAFRMRAHEGKIQGGFNVRADHRLSRRKLDIVRADVDLARFSR